MAAIVRVVEPQDAAAIQAIYAPYCESTAISFEAVPPSVEQVAERIANVSVMYPWLVCESNGQMTGYLYAYRHRERAAYRWAVDVAVYVDRLSHRRGVGRGLYTSLLPILRRQGLYKAYASVTLPNAGSVGLHESVGFRRVAIYEREGFKLGQWRDVIWMELDLQPDFGDPSEPIPFSALRDSPDVTAALATGAKLIRG